MSHNARLQPGENGSAEDEEQGEEVWRFEQRAEGMQASRIIRGRPARRQEKPMLVIVVSNNAVAQRLTRTGRQLPTAI